MLPAGFIPDDISVMAGGTARLLPPSGASDDKVFVPTIRKEFQAGLWAKVVVYHGKLKAPK